MIKNYFKTAFRNLWKNKIYGSLNVFGLAIGIACAGLIFLWVEDEVSYNYNHVKKDQLYKILENQPFEGKTYTFSATPGLLAEAMKKEFPGIKNSCRLTWEEYTLFNLGEKSIYERGNYADSSIFSMFTIPFVQGKKETVFQQLHSLAISEKMAKKFFGDQKDIIGKKLKVDNNEEYVIGGVFKDLPQSSSLRFDWLSPFKIYHDKNDWLNQWNTNGTQTFVELEEKTDPGLINKKLANYLRAKDTTIVAQPFLFSMNDWRLHSKFEEGKQVGGRIQNVRTFSIIAWIILLIACINFMNLATARSEKRAREVGVRKVLGAGKKLLIAQFIGEAMIMALLSLLIAVAIIYLILPSFDSLVEKQLQIGLDNPLHLLSLILIGLICGLIAGSYPALYLSSFNPVWVFKGINLKGSGAAYIRKGLVVLQFTISIVLIIGTIIVYNQIQHIKNRDLGYNKDNVIQTGLRGDMQKNFAVIKNQLLSSGYVENVAMSNLNQLYMGSSTGNFEWEGKDPSKKVLVTQDFISPEYIKTMGIQMSKGRDFYPDAKQDSSNVIINEAFAKVIGKNNVVGTLLRQDTTKYTIVGVIKDFVFDDMYGKSDPLIFRSYPEYFGYMYIRLKSQANVERAVDKIQTIVKSNNPGYPFDYIFVDDEFDKQFKSEMLIGKLSRIFALLAIVITCLGLFGLAAYTAERRTKEIGVRKVLGASVTGIAGLLSKDFLKLVILSSLISFPVAWWLMHNWLQNYAYRIEISWWIFIVAAALAIVIALFTISFQAIKAALSNPVKSLRTE
ncbi:MAG TPA: ABC transporter permease [Chitinophagaceae bacterium]|nr:ABC transporter permease [Chitinophagaceae bacterium]